MAIFAQHKAKIVIRPFVSHLNPCDKDARRIATQTALVL